MLPRDDLIQSLDAVIIDLFFGRDWFQESNNGGYMPKKFPCVFFMQFHQIGQVFKIQEALQQ